MQFSSQGRNRVASVDNVVSIYRMPILSMLLSASYKVSAMKTTAGHVVFPSTVESTLAQ